MATFQRVLLSGSTNGKPLAVAATATPGTLIHTATAGTGQSAMDEVYLWVSNVSGAAANLTLEWGGATTGELLTSAVSIPANSAPIPIAFGQNLNGASVVRAFSATANVLNITGFVNRIA